MTVPSSPRLLDSQLVEANPSFSQVVSSSQPISETELEVCNEPSERIPIQNANLPQISPQQSTVCWRVELEIFTSTFLTIFLAELGDKTQVTTLLMSAESQAPWIVFAGSGTALVVTSLMGILLGRWLSTKISPKTLEVAAASLLLFISVMLFLDIWHGY